MDYQALGARIRELRKQRGFTQEGLANSVEISYSYMGLVERGERKLSVETLFRIARALNANMDYLVNGPQESASTSDGSVIFKIISSLHHTETDMGLSPEQRKAVENLFRVIVENVDKWCP